MPEPTHTTGREDLVFTLAAEAGIAHAAREHAVLLAGLRIRLTRHGHPEHGPAVAEATAHADGRPIRVQVAATSLDALIDALVERTVARLIAQTGPWHPRPAQDPTRTRLLYPPLTWRPHAQITRTKTVTTVTCAPAVAAAAMDAHDYDIHLFTDPDTRRHAAVHRTGPTGYTLTRIVRVPPAHSTDPAITLDPRQAPHLTTEHAVRHLNTTGQPYLFYADEATGDGHILYRRYDGHYTILTPADNDAR